MPVLPNLDANLALNGPSARFIGPGPLLTHTTPATNMEEGGKTKKTIFVGGIGEDVDEQVMLETFSTFGGSCW
jgi:RNA recognition motif-containing protein